ncbi:MAG TPA: hypothetical protein VIX59_15060 [Candidatus Binataceae bacterium]
MPSPRQAALGDFIELQPPAAERLELETAPRAETVQSFVLTRAAERSWQSINRHLGEPHGALFWIGGPAGCGKTHFLNYVFALATRAGSLAAEPSRHLICGLEVAGRARSPEVEACLLDVLARQIGGDQQSALMWREMRGAGALNVALEAARRTGVRALTVAIDFSLSPPELAADYFATLAEVAARMRAVKFTVLAAGRGRAPELARVLEVAPRDSAEEIATALRRVRRLRAVAQAALDDFYQGIDTGGLTADAIFPFHPIALSALRALVNPPGTVAELARAAREAIVEVCEQNALMRVLYPADLVASPSLARRVKSRMGESGRAALEIAYDSLAGFHGNEKELAHQIVDTLALGYLAENSTGIGVAEIAGRVPMLAGNESGETWTGPAVNELLRRLAARTRGVIRFESGAARFDPDAAGAPEVAIFNAALPLLHRFDPTLAAARDKADLKDRLSRLRNAMADAFEAASRTRAVLEAALGEANLPLADEHQRAIAEYIALVELSAGALLEAGADSRRREAASAVVSAYDSLAAAAAMVPRMRAMREYLDATGLHASYDEEPAKDPRVVTLETECQLLGVELGPRALAGAPRNLDALEARFQKFKWTYVQQYRSEHEQWRLEMEQLAMRVGDARRYLDALRRLNAIAALGPPEGGEIVARIAAVAARVVRCDLTGSLQPEVTPRCPRCGYLLGTPSPRAELAELMEYVRRALDVKLAALSQSAIARLIRNHDQTHRLEGFLKITQAAQTEALVRVLDEKLARYLAQLLDENLAAGSTEPAPRGVVRRIDRSDVKAARVSRPGKTLPRKDARKDE